jgi:hypothetical protein
MVQYNPTPGLRQSQRFQKHRSRCFEVPYLLDAELALSQF